MDYFWILKNIESIILKITQHTLYYKVSAYIFTAFHFHMEEGEVIYAYSGEDVAIILTQFSYKRRKSPA